VARQVAILRPWTRVEAPDGRELAHAPTGDRGVGAFFTGMVIMPGDFRFDPEFLHA
jgi:hypothetical protein